MSKSINIFTFLVFAYSLVVCLTCKYVNPDKVGNIHADFTKEVSVDQSVDNFRENDKPQVAMDESALLIYTMIHADN